MVSADIRRCPDVFPLLVASDKRAELGVGNYRTRLEMPLVERRLDLVSLSNMKRVELGAFT